MSALCPGRMTQAEGRRLICYRPEHHDGPHWDRHDHVTWTEDLTTCCTTIEHTCGLWSVRTLPGPFQPESFSETT